MLKPITPNEQRLIVRNVIAACKDTEKLNKRGYNFLYLCSGFIAHYNLEGFKGVYSPYGLRADIARYKRYNQWQNFKPGDKNYEYYKSKADTYNQICNCLGV
jgi:hypothetical protein